MAKKTYDFKEKKEEWSQKQGKKIPVWQTPKYEESKAKAIQIIEEYDDISEGDFWILMNETKNGQMMYSGLIISHNACLKINDHLSSELKFKPECVRIDKVGYANSLVFIYCCPEQGLYEVGEVTPNNCKNPYPYAMALKRCMDRVILKNSKIAFAGIYSDVEADEFKEQHIDAPQTAAPQQQASTDQYVAEIRRLAAERGIQELEICNIAQVTKIENMYEGQMKDCIAWLMTEPVRVQGGTNG